jgi:hypothetical protein
MDARWVQQGDDVSFVVAWIIGFALVDILVGGLLFLHALRAPPGSPRTWPRGTSRRTFPR